MGVEPAGGHGPWNVNFMMDSRVSMVDRMAAIEQIHGPTVCQCHKFRVLAK